MHSSKWVERYCKDNPQVDPIAAATEFQRRIKLPFEFITDNGPHGDELAEVVGKFLDMGERKEV